MFTLSFLLTFLVICIVITLAALHRGMNHPSEGQCWLTFLFLMFDMSLVVSIAMIAFEMDKQKISQNNTEIQKKLTEIEDRLNNQLATKGY